MSTQYAVIHMKEDDDCRVKEKITKEEKKMMISYIASKNILIKMSKKMKEIEQGWTTINETVSFNIYFLVDDFELRDF